MVQNSGLEFDTAGVNAYYRLSAIENGSSYQPYIHVTYNDLPPAATLISPNDGDQVITPTPTLSANTVTDPNGDAMKYWFRVSDTTNPEVGQIINSGWQTTPTWTIPQGSLIDGVTYTWYVITWDGNSANVYEGSAWRKFTLNMHLGNQPADPTDSKGPVKVNLVSGNVSTAITSPTVQTVGGDMGVSYNYNSQAQQTLNGLTASFYDGCNWSTFPGGGQAPYITRTDPNIDYNWGTGSPGPSIQNDRFCGTWDGYITAPMGNQYCFSASSDDGFRVWVNSTEVVNQWSDGGTPNVAPSCNVQLYATSVPIHAEFYENGGSAAVQLRVYDPHANATFPVPASWLSTVPTTTPAGWQASFDTSTQGAQYTRANVLTNAVVLQSDGADPESYAVSGSANGVTFFTSPKGVDTILTYSGGYYSAVAADGFTYRFDVRGLLVSKTSQNDDLAPANTTYTYGSGDTAMRLTSMQDPVSGKQITLKYSNGLMTGSPCSNAPSGFSPQGPVGMVCEIDYPDYATNPSDKTVLYYSAADVTGELMREVDPGNAVTDFSYGANAMLNGIADPSQMDYRANHTSNGVYTRINYDASNRASSVVLASSDGSDGTDMPPTTNRPWHSYSYTTPFVSGTGGESRINVGGMSPPQGFASKFVFNGLGQTTASTDQTGVVAENVWDKEGRLLSTKNDTTNLVSSSVYDINRDVTTDSYGPAPASCFTAANVTGTDNEVRSISTPNGSCTSPAVAHSSTAYDEGINGLAITWWKNANWAGTPAAHSTRIRAEDTDGRIAEGWPTTGPYIFGGTQPSNYSLTAAGEWYAHNTGTYTVLEGAVSGDVASIAIDGKLVASGSTGTPTGTYVSTSVGWHDVSIVYSHTTATTPQLSFYIQAPGTSSPSPVSSTDLRPDYNLATTQTTFDDNTTGSPSLVSKSFYGTTSSGVDPAYGLAQSTSVDPTGLNLTTSAGYEAPLTSGFLRQTSKTLPAGNQTQYTYYPAIGTPPVVPPPTPPTNPCTGTSAGNQGGLMATRVNPLPEAGTGTQIVENFVYDIWGRAVAQWENSDSPTCTSYDARGRVTQVTYPASGAYPIRTVTYSYGVGADSRVNSVSDATGTITSMTDLLGRAVSSTDVWGITSTNSYDLTGRPTDTVSPGDARHTDYDNVGRIADQKAGNDGSSLVTMAIPTYNSANEITSVNYPSGTGNGGNGTLVTVGYDGLHRNSALTATNSSGTITSDNVTFSQSGRVIDESIDGTDSHSGNNFTYDWAGRLVEAWVPGHHLYYLYGATTGCAQNAAGKNTPTAQASWTMARQQRLTVTTVKIV